MAEPGTTVLPDREVRCEGADDGDWELEKAAARLNLLNSAAPHLGAGTEHSGLMRTNSEVSVSEIVEVVTSLSTRGCQYHGGRTNEEGFLIFCRKPARHGTSYCREHYERIYQRSPVFGAPRVAAPVESAELDAANAPVAPEVEWKAA